MLTFVYISENQNVDLENHLREQSEIMSAEILHYKGASFAKVYNKALKDAKNDVIVFLREDIEIHSKGFGPKLLDHFSKSNYGILGLVGSVIVPMSGLVWEKEEPLVGRIWYGSFEPKSENRFSEVFRNKVIPVVTVDDVFFAVDRKKLAVHFETCYEGDSFYDLSFCLANYNKGVKIGVIFDVKLMKIGLNEHDKGWQENQKIFVKKHQDLPSRIKPKILMSTAPLKLERQPKISLILAAKDKPVEVASCLESIQTKSSYTNLEILVVDLGSTENNLNQMRSFLLNYANAQLIENRNEHLPTVYEEVIQEYVSDDTELLCFCHPEIILLNDALTRIAKVYLENPNECGTLGVRMHTTNNMVRHFGLQLFSTETQEGFELGLGFQGFQSAYRYKNQVIKDVLGSSMDFMMVPKELFYKIKGFNKNYLHSLEDFEFNLSAILAGRRNFLVGTAACYFTGPSMPKFLPDDFLTLIDFVNHNVESITSYVDLICTS